MLGWRDVPVVSSSIGPVARSREPHLKQIFIGKNAQIKDQATLERKLLVIRKMAERKIAESDLQHKNMFYICSLSTQTLVYKGQLMSEQLHPYFPDLANPTMESALAMVHSRYSTNTFPSWDRAHPYRFIAHNGEINTLRGNINWMHARETLLSNPIFGDDIKKLMPVINPDGSDSAMFDNVVEMLVAGGTLAAARDANDGSGSLERKRFDGRREKSFLRISLDADGAVGRPGVDGLYRRPHHRRACWIATDSVHRVLW